MNTLEAIYKLVVDDSLSPSSETVVLEALDCGQFSHAIAQIETDMSEMENLSSNSLLGFPDLERYGKQATLLYLLEAHRDNN